MRRFLGLDFTLEQVPDATALLSFRHLLEKYALGKNLLDSRPEIFEDHRWILRGGNIVDVTIIPAPSLAKSASGARDPEMCQTKKADQWHFGMKAEVDVNAGPDSAAQSCTESVRAKIEYPSLNAPTTDHLRPRGRNQDDQRFPRSHTHDLKGSSPVRQLVCSHSWQSLSPIVDEAIGGIVREFRHQGCGGQALGISSRSGGHLYRHRKAIRRETHRNDDGGQSAGILRY